MSDKNSKNLEYNVRVNNDKLEEDLKEIQSLIEKKIDGSIKDVEKSGKRVINNLTQESKTAIKEIAEALKEIAQYSGINIEINEEEVKNKFKSITEKTELELDIDTSKSKKKLEDLEDHIKTLDGEVEIEIEKEKLETKLEETFKKKNIKINASTNIPEVESQFKSLEDTVKTATDSITKDLEKIVENASELEGAEKFFENFGDAAQEAFSGAMEELSPLAGTIANLGNGFSPTAQIAFDVGSAFVGLGTQAVNTADEMKSAMNNFLAETGKSKEETERYQEVLEEIYKNGYGNNFEDIADAMAHVSKNMDELDDESLQKLVESAFVFEKVFGYDIQESVKTSKKLMDNFGISGETAMNMIAAGAQSSLGQSDDFLMNISKYSEEFSELGLDADSMFQIFQKGADEGAFSMEEIGDAITKMSDRMATEAQAVEEGFELLGLNSDEMTAKFAAGGESAKEAFDETMEALAAIEDPMEQNAAGIALMGDAWEELSPGAVTALAAIEEGAYATSEELNNMKEITGDDFSSKIEEFQRNLETLLIPLGEELLPILSTLVDSVLPVLIQLLSPLVEVFVQLLEPIMLLIEAALPPLIEAFQGVINFAIVPLLDVVQNLLIPIFSAGIGNLVAAIRGNIESIKSIFKGIIDFVKNVFTGDWDAAWQNVKEIFEAIADGIGNAFKLPINTIIDAINVFIRGINKIKIPKWVPVVGGKGFKLDTIPRLKVGLDYVPNDMFPAFLDEGEWVLTKEEANILRSFGGIEGVIAVAGNTESTQGVIIENQNEIDYDAIGTAVYGAFKRHGFGVTINGREFGRIVEKTLAERGH